MQLSTTYLNRWVELFEGVYGSETHKQIQAVSRLYNRHAGPVTSTRVERPELLDPGFYCAACNHSPIDLLIPDLTVRPDAAQAMGIPGGGKGHAQYQAFLGALGELSERLVSVFHFPAIVDQLEFGSWTELRDRGLNSLNPARLPLFAPEQYEQKDFPFVPFREDTPLRWIRGTYLLSGEDVFVPAQLYLLYYKRAAGEPLIGYPTSGGLAFHPERQRAILHALYEFIERDAINVRWYCRLAPPQVKIDLSAFVHAQWHLRHTRISTPSLNNFQLYANTLDVPIPIFTVVTYDNSKKQGAFLGAGGAWSHRDRALAQALFELGQTRAVLNAYKPGPNPIRADSNIKEMTEFLHGAIYFGFKENRSLLDWYSSGESVDWDDIESLPFENTSTEYMAALQMVERTGLNPIVLDFSATGWGGASVLRVIVPELTGACVAAHPYLGHPRYNELPCRMGLAARPLRFCDLNRDPIPFP